jgi:hypothetical protein
VFPEPEESLRFNHCSLSRSRDILRNILDPFGDAPELVFLRLKIGTFGGWAKRQGPAR